MPQNSPFGGRPDFSDIEKAIRSFFTAVKNKFHEWSDSFAAWLDTGSPQRPEKKRSAEEVDAKAAFARVWDVVTWCLVGIVVVLAVLLVGVRVVGLRPFCVLSGSMEPMYKTGSLIYVKKADPADVKIGDAITFVLNEDLVVATHQVYDIDYEKGCFFTQGIANKDSAGNILHDGAPVYFENLIGRPVFTIPYLGFVSDYLTHPPGMYVGISAALVLLILFFLPDLLRLADDTDKADSGKPEEKAKVKPQPKKPVRIVSEENRPSAPARRYFPEYDPAYEPDEDDESDDYDGGEYEDYDYDDGSIIIGGDDYDE